MPEETEDEDCTGFRETCTEKAAGLATKLDFRVWGGVWSGCGGNCSHSTGTANSGENHHWTAI